MFSGCTSLTENNDISNLPTLSPAESSEADVNQAVSVALYFPDKQTKKLSAEMREIEMQAGVNPGNLIIGALLRGPRESGLSSLGTDISVQNVEITDEVANVYFETNRAQEQEQKFILSSAAADTLIDYFGVKYVCVYINGDVLTIDGAPCGPLTKSDGNISALYQQYISKYSPFYVTDANQKREMNVVLYFADPSGRYMRPEVRKITFEDENYMEAIMEQLALGPAYKYYLQNVVGGNFIPSQQMQVVDTGVQNRKYLSFTENPFPNATSDASQMLAISSVYYTFAGLLPDTERLTCEINDSPKVVTRQIANSYLGQSITIYFPNMDLTSLDAVSRTVQQSKSNSLETYMEEIIRGPIDVDAEDIWPSFPEEITIDDVRSINVKGSMAIIDFSDNFLVQMEKMSEKKKVLLIYSIVNTFAGVENVKTVQFLIEGKKVQSVGGDLDLYSPFMPNPGIQK